MILVDSEWSSRHTNRANSLAADQSVAPVTRGGSLRRHGEGLAWHSNFSRCVKIRWLKQVALQISKKC